ncbi:hypothetical protein HK100_000032 [Physocladia obscura]|uniref:Heterokaryon incompatibility domain-containing protein n=1 Tax=Physocladia obscura TaxID=109957 RepID=A0AAD5XHL1_9FUNG|nr:hypothetical protein HK100_000032 [Physocladia obscura]
MDMSNMRLWRKNELVPFTAEAPYAAISHIWGNVSESPRTAYGQVFGFDWTLPDTSWLRAVLKYPSQLSLPTWLDLTCINQDDPSDCLYNIKHMGNVYFYSAECHVLLDEHDTKVLLALLEELECGEYKVSDESIQTNRDVLSGMFPGAGESKEFTAAFVFMAFMDKWTHVRWFLRVWTMQEMILPPKVLLFGLRDDEWVEVCELDNVWDGLTEIVGNIFSKLRSCGLDPKVCQAVETFVMGKLKQFAVHLRKRRHEILKPFGPDKFFVLEAITNSWRRTEKQSDLIYGTNGLVGWPNLDEIANLGPREMGYEIQRLALLTGQTSLLQVSGIAATDFEVPVPVAEHINDPNHPGWAILGFEPETIPIPTILPVPKNVLLNTTTDVAEIPCRLLKPSNLLQIGSSRKLVRFYCEVGQYPLDSCATSIQHAVSCALLINDDYLTKVFFCKSALWLPQSLIPDICLVVSSKRLYLTVKSKSNQKLVAWTSRDYTDLLPGLRYSDEDLQLSIPLHFDSFAQSLLDTAPGIGLRECRSHLCFNSPGKATSEAPRGARQRIRLIDVFSQQVKWFPAGTQYDCVSHVWRNGSENFGGTLYEQCGALKWDAGAFGADQLKITLAFLKNYGCQYLWIDALCLELDWLGRKCHSQMAHVFEDCSRCFVWPEGFGVAWKEESIFNTAEFGQKPAPLKWLTRVWTLQEAWLPPMLLFLQSSTSRPAYVAMEKTEFLALAGAQGRSENMHHKQLLMELFFEDWRPTLANLTRQLSFRDCTLPEDRVNGILGLISWLPIHVRQPLSRIHGNQLTFAVSVQTQMKLYGLGPRPSKNRASISPDLWFCGSGRPTLYYTLMANGSLALDAYATTPTSTATSMKEWDMRMHSARGDTESINRCKILNSLHPTGRTVACSLSKALNDKKRGRFLLEQTDIPCPCAKNCRTIYTLSCLCVVQQQEEFVMDVYRCIGVEWFVTLGRVKWEYRQAVLQDWDQALIKFS